jgi:hypothetical protein
VQAAASRAGRHGARSRFFISVQRVGCTFIEAKVSTLVLKTCGTLWPVRSLVPSGRERPRWPGPARAQLRGEEIDRAGPARRSHGIPVQL